MTNQATHPETVYGSYLTYGGFRDWMNESTHSLRTLSNGEITNRPEPLNICSVCGRLESHIEIVHNGKHVICLRHPKFMIHKPPPEGFFWRDIMQLSIGHAIISEINKCTQ